MRIERPGAAWTAFGWALLFGMVHIYWALGGSLGLPAGFVMRDHRAIFIADLIAIPLCGLAALLAIELSKVQKGGWRRRLILAGGAAATFFFFAHALPPLTAALLKAAQGAPVLISEKERLSLLLYEPYWLLGGLLFGAATWRLRSAITAS